MELSLIIAIISVIFCIANFVLARKDKAVNDTKQNHQELIEYQLKELKEDYKDIASDIKEIKISKENEEMVSEFLKEYYESFSAIKLNSDNLLMMIK